MALIISLSILQVTNLGLREDRKGTPGLLLGVRARIQTQDSDFRALTCHPGVILPPCRWLLFMVFTSQSRIWTKMKPGWEVVGKDPAIPMS